MKTREQIRRDVQAARAELDPIQLAIWRDMPPERKLRLVGDMFAALKQITLAGLRQDYPDASAEDIHILFLAKFFRRSDWQPEHWADFEAHARRRYRETHPAGESDQKS